MNERIKKLADNATYYANGVCDADANADWYETRDQMFAELIVKECIDIADEEDFEGMMREGYPCSQTAKKIKQHFGVE